jgi:hypothetical protein
MSRNTLPRGPATVFQPSCCWVVLVRQSPGFYWVTSGQW